MALFLQDNFHIYCLFIALYHRPKSKEIYFIQTQEKGIVGALMELLYACFTLLSISYFPQEIFQEKRANLYRASTFIFARDFYGCPLFLLSLGWQTTATEKF